MVATLRFSTVEGRVHTLTLADLARKIIPSKTLRRTLGTAFFLLIVFFGLLRLRQALESLETGNVYRKDFLQEYLLARATIAGTEPYLPVESLAATFIGKLPVPVFPHPTPHPPPTALLGLPVGFLNYKAAATIWLVFELVCLAGTIRVLLACCGKTPSAGVLLLLMLAAITTAPVWTDLIVGQLMLPLLLLFSSAWLALKSGKEYLAGIFLGLALALKLMGLPILIFLALRQRWNALKMIAVTAGTANVLCILLMGPVSVADYYFSVSKTLLPLYRAAPPNFSLWTIGWRLFEGTGSPVLVAFRAPPLLHAPWLAPAVSLMVPVLMLGCGVIAALRARDGDLAFGILIGVSILVHPIAWNHYLVLMAIPVVVALIHLSRRGFPGRECIFLLCIGLLLGLPRERLTEIQEPFAHLSGNQLQTIPFFASLLDLTYAAAILAMLWLLFHLDHSTVRSKASAA